jgi:hypothetical protein
MRRSGSPFSTLVYVLPPSAPKMSRNLDVVISRSGVAVRVSVYAAVAVAVGPVGAASIAVGLGATAGPISSPSGSMLTPSQSDPRPTCAVISAVRDGGGGCPLARERQSLAGPLMDVTGRRVGEFTAWRLALPSPPWSCTAKLKNLLRLPRGSHPAAVCAASAGSSGAARRTHASPLVIRLATR